MGLHLWSPEGGGLLYRESNVCGLQGGPAKEWEQGAGSAILVQSSVVVSSRLGHVHVLRVHRDDRMLGTRRKMVIWIYTLILSPSLQIR